MFNTRKEWDWYWTHDKNNFLNRIYDIFASFCRLLIISPAAFYFLRKNFPRGACLLHAGCGGGEVDKGMVGIFQITAVDFSREAISLYKMNNPGAKGIVLADIFDLPFKDNCFDGAYNLGVLEHYRNKDVVLALKEMARVVRRKGRIVIFWPPEFGLSVLFFKVFYFFIGILGNYRKKMKFYPDEVNRLKSRKHAEVVLEKANLKLLDFYFGWRVFFTYCVVVCEVRE